MARIDVIMPQMGESIAEGTVSRWLKQVGDQVKRDEAILEISTDKVDAEIPAPSAGVVTEIKVAEGQTVAVQTVIAVIETDAAAAAAAAPAAQPPQTPPEVETPVPAPAPAPTPEAAPPTPPTVGEAPVAAVADETSDERVRRRSTPLVRRMAAEHGIDLAQIPGSGFAGRVTKKDLVAYIERGAPEPEIAPAPPPRPASVPTGEVMHPVVEAWPGDEVVPMSRIRKLTADHMVMSRRISAHVTSFYEVDYTRIAELRAQIKRDYQARGANPTYLSFIVKVIADNLRKHRVVNSSVSGGSIIHRKPINVGIAVALEWGLIVPVLKNADELSLVGIARKIADLAERARTKRLNPDEVQQGTFTITNPGVFGSFAGAPIINQPQVAILGVGSIEKRPKVITLEDGQDGIAIRTMGMLTLSYDHRVVDGADADRFMADVKQDLETFPEGAV
jgi:2-oxoglutarate dehydrogenase E2 component (dihydrolipoamide succinyltransferase)